METQGKKLYTHWTIHETMSGTFIDIFEGDDKVGEFDLRELIKEKLSKENYTQG